MPDQHAVLRGLEREDLFTVVFEQVLHRHRAATPTSCCRPPRSSSTTTSRGYGADAMLARQAGDRAGRRVAAEHRRVRRARACAWACSDGPAEDETEAAVPRRAPAARRRSARRCSPTAWRRAAGRQPPDPVRRRASRHRRRQDPPVPRRRSTRRAGGLYSYQADPATDDHPLALISPASEKTISSTLGELRTRPRVLHMHTADAAARGVTDGDAVRVFNALGEVHCLVEVTDAIREGTVSLPRGCGGAARSTSRPPPRWRRRRSPISAAARASTTRGSRSAASSRRRGRASRWPCSVPAGDPVQ